MNVNNPGSRYLVRMITVNIAAGIFAKQQLKGLNNPDAEPWKMQNPRCWPGAPGPSRKRTENPECPPRHQLPCSPQIPDLHSARWSAPKSAPRHIVTSHYTHPCVLSANPFLRTGRTVCRCIGIPRIFVYSTGYVSHRSHVRRLAPVT